MIPDMKPDFLSSKVSPYFITEAETCYNSRWPSFFVDEKLIMFETTIFSRTLTTLSAGGCFLKFANFASV